MMYEMVTGKHPFADMHWAVMMTGLFNGSLDVEWPEDMERHFRRLCESCVDNDASKRPTAAVMCKVGLQPFSMKCMKGKDSRSNAAWLSINGISLFIIAHLQILLALDESLRKRWAMERDVQ